MKEFKRCTRLKDVPTATSDRTKAPLGTCPAPCYDDLKRAVMQCEQERLSAQMSGFETGWEHPNTQTMWQRVVATVNNS